MIKKHIPTALFALFIFGIFIAEVVSPTKDFSEMENRFLSQYMAPTSKSIMDGKFMTDYETYVNDQFILRSDWITIKSVGETVMLKTENNGIAYGKDRFLFDKTKIDTTQDSRFRSNLDYITEFARETKQENIYISLIPSSAEIYKEYLPYGLEQDNQTEIISEAYSQLENSGITAIDVGTKLFENKDDYIYYKTDHHWTTQGAYTAYESFMDEKGYKPVELDSPAQHTVEGFYGTYYSKAKWVLAKPDTLTYWDFPVENVVIDDAEKDSLYDLSQFEKRDKYAGFLHGNSGLTVINSQVKNGKNILVVKDSYAMVMIPFFTQNYENIYMVDLRYYKGTPALLENVDFDDIYIIYYLINFSTDGNVINLLSE